MNPFVSHDQTSLEDMLVQMNEAVCVLDEHLIIQGANQHFADWYTDSPPSAILGQPLTRWVPDIQRSVFFDGFKHCLQTGESTIRFGFSTKLGSWVSVRLYHVSSRRCLFLIHRLEEHRSDREDIWYVDPMTSLPNRLMFERDIEALNHQKTQHPSLGSQTNLIPSMGLTLVDISHFKRLNQSLGFQKGDLCLMKLASLLKQHLPVLDRVYRMGPDQFLILGSWESEVFEQRLAGIKHVYEHPLSLGDLDVSLSYHLVHHCLKGQETSHQALQKIEAGLTWAKTKQINEVYFEPSMLGPIYDPSLIHDIEVGIKECQFQLYFQPEIDLQGRATSSAEVLLRWLHPTRGLLLPDDFVPFAEETRLIRDIDLYVCEQTMKFLVKQSKQISRLRQDLTLSINLSSQSLSNLQTLESIKHLFDKYPIDPGQMCFEIVENALIHDIQTSQEIIEGLKNLGFKVAIDDFGTGYSSMSYLVRYPAHFIKIDRLFIRDMEQVGRTQSMIKNLIELAHGMGMSVIAEGVETQRQAELLQQFGCDLGQGYWFAPPMIESSFLEWMLIHCFSRRGTCLIPGTSSPISASKHAQSPQEHISEIQTSVDSKS